MQWTHVGYLLGVAGLVIVASIVLTPRKPPPPFREWITDAEPGHANTVLTSWRAPSGECLLYDLHRNALLFVPARAGCMVSGRSPVDIGVNLGPARSFDAVDNLLLVPDASDNIHAYPLPEGAVLRVVRRLQSATPTTPINQVLAEELGSTVANLVTLRPRDRPENK